jgi:hypothetical protein
MSLYGFIGKKMSKRKTMINILSIVLATGLLLFSPLNYANDDFQQWMQQQSEGIAAEKNEFQQYKDQRDKEFTDFLKSQWKPVDIVKGNVRDETPKPVVMPVAKPEPEVSLPISQPVMVSVPKPIIVKPIIAPIVVDPKGRPARIDFYGKMLTFYFDGALRQSISGAINKEAISHYWSRLSRADYEGVLTQLQQQKKSLQLNDWAYASMINKLAIKINHGHRNESALLSWFFLAKSGYRARVAYNSSFVYLLIPSQQEMFEIPYFTFADKRYYAAEFDGEKQKLGKVFTYDGEYPETNKDFDMHVSSVVASNDQAERRHLSFEFDGRQYPIEVSYDRGRIKFLRDYPQLNLSLYFSSGVYKTTATPLQQQLAMAMKGMSEQQAVNFLLRFVQTALKYETDQQQFGKENYLFPEETLFYPYSDCEDRAVLFAWLVHSLLGLEVIGLDYPGHVAAAVHFNEQVKGDGLTYQGKHFVVTDPTFINASIGMTMPDFKKYKPNVIRY